MSDLKNKIKQIRRDVLTMAHEGKTSHVGSALSCVEILSALYFELMDLDNDRFILSKGHGAMALYAVMVQAGLLDPEDLKSYAHDGGALGEHPSHQTNGIFLSTGSLGHGLAVGAGMALAKKMDQAPGKVFVVLSDGECNEGSVWEAAMCASAQGLDNLVVIVDDNHMQAMGPSREISGLDPLSKKWDAFGWSVIECDGNDVGALIQSYNEINSKEGKPKAIVARTRLGAGVSFMEDKLLWHYQIPSADDLRVAFEELERP